MAMSFPTPRGSRTAVLDAVTSSRISHELHQTAQPLTALQGLLELALLMPHTAEEYRSVVQQAMEHSLRISGCFDHLRELFNHRSLSEVVTLPNTQQSPEMHE